MTASASTAPTAVSFAPSSPSDMNGDDVAPSSRSKCFISSTQSQHQMIPPPSMAPTVSFNQSLMPPLSSITTRPGPAIPVIPSPVPSTLDRTQPPAAFRPTTPQAQHSAAPTTPGGGPGTGSGSGSGGGGGAMRRRVSDKSHLPIAVGECKSFFSLQIL